MAAGGWYAESAGREDAAHDDFVKAIEAASQRIVSDRRWRAPPPSSEPLLESLDDLGAAGCRCDALQSMERARRRGAFSAELRVVGYPIDL